MSPETVVQIGSLAIKVTFLIAAPVLIVGMVVGIIISVFQAATQIQEMTLTFVPKVIAVAAVLFIMGPWMMRILINFTVQLIGSIPSFIR